METPPVGSLVVPAPRFREQMRTGEGAAILLAILRSSGHLWYASTDLGYHVPLKDVRPIPADAVPGQSREALLSGLILWLGAEECSLEPHGGDALDLTLDIPRLPADRVDELRARLGERLLEFSVEPGGRHAITLSLRLVRLPPSHGAGR